MPAHRVTHGDQPAQTLADAIGELEANGETIIQVISLSGESVVITAARLEPLVVTRMSREATR